MYLYGISMGISLIKSHTVSTAERISPKGRPRRKQEELE
jgi:hypothetical protein